MRRAYKYILKLTDEQKLAVEQMLDTHRHLYNEALAMRIAAYEEDGRTLRAFDQTRWYTTIWRDHPFYAQIDVYSAHLTIKRLDLAYQAFFRRVREGSQKPGFPHFKSKDRYNSIIYGYKMGATLVDDHTVRFAKLGNLTFNCYRPMQGKPKTVAIKREVDRWYVIFSCDLGAIEVPPNPGPAVAIDLGVAGDFYHASDGTLEQSPAYFEKSLAKLRKLARAVASKVKGSKNQAKAKLALAKFHRKIANQRKNHQHHLSRDFVTRYGALTVTVPQFKPAETKKGKLKKTNDFNRTIYDTALPGFTEILKHKCAETGTALETITVDREIVVPQQR